MGSIPHGVDPGDDVSVSKFLSLILRHRPDVVGIELDSGGWVGVDVLLKAISDRCPIDRSRLEGIVSGSDKQRFQLEGQRIRAHQGHSVAVELELATVAPPAVLFHGTPKRFVASIMEHGITAGARHDVHLSADEGLAARVGARRGEPIVLTVDAAAMARDGFEFRVTGNGVWLTAHVPPRYLRVP